MEKRLEGGVKRGVKMLLEGATIADASKITSIDRKTLRRYRDRYSDIPTIEVRQLKLLKRHRPPYLSPTKLETLRLFALSLDFNGFP